MDMDMDMDMDADEVKGDDSDVAQHGSSLSHDGSCDDSSGSETDDHLCETDKWYKRRCGVGTCRHCTTQIAQCLMCERIVREPEYIFQEHVTECDWCHCLICSKCVFQCPPSLMFDSIYKMDPDTKCLDCADALIHDCCACDHRFYDKDGSENVCQTCKGRPCRLCWCETFGQCETCVLACRS